jgi:hypothetical protein
MPALVYTDEKVGDVLGLQRVKTNRDQTSMSVYFNYPDQKVQFGKLDEPTFRFRKFVRDGDDQRGVQLNVVSKRVRKWWDQFHVDLLFDYKDKRKEWHFPKADTHDLQHVYQSNVRTKTDAAGTNKSTVLEFRLAKSPNYFLYTDEGEYERIQDTDVTRNMLCIPLVRFVGLWINGKESSSEWGCVLEATDLMCYEDEDDGEEEHEESEQLADLRPFRKNVNSPVQSVFPGSAEQSLYEKQFK